MTFERCTVSDERSDEREASLRGKAVLRPNRGIRSALSFRSSLQPSSFAHRYSSPVLVVVHEVVADVLRTRHRTVERPPVLSIDGHQEHGECADLKDAQRRYDTIHYLRG